jgi:hypothetical protein
MSHLKRTTRIHAPLEQVYATAHDPTHWSDWYVGISNEKGLEVTESDQARFLMVGTPFPLTQRVLEDRLQGTEAHWRVKPDGNSQTIDICDSCKMLMISGEQDWSYSSKKDETEVSVVLDFAVPSELVERAEDRNLIERMEAECLERSLENLRVLCETTH